MRIGVNKMPDCGDNSCRYRDRSQPSGMRTNGGCRCDECPVCGRHVRPGGPVGHYHWCTQQDWLPEHHRKQLTMDNHELAQQYADEIKAAVDLYLADAIKYVECSQRTRAVWEKVKQAGDDVFSLVYQMLQEESLKEMESALKEEGSEPHGA